MSLYGLEETLEAEPSETSLEMLIQDIKPQRVSKKCLDTCLDDYMIR